MDVFDLCRSEVVAGQFLDVSVQARGRADVETAMTVLRYKSAKYSIERPLHVGAALAGASPDVLEELTAFGLPLGEAFQLRDDQLGVFGDPEVTGKPAGDDLVEGKRTVLVALALDAVSPADAAVLQSSLGTRADDGSGRGAPRHHPRLRRGPSGRGRHRRAGPAGARGARQGRGARRGAGRVARARGRCHRAGALARSTEVRVFACRSACSCAPKCVFLRAEVRVLARRSVSSCVPRSEFLRPLDDGPRRLSTGPIPGPAGCRWCG